MEQSPWRVTGIILANGATHPASSTRIQQFHVRMMTLGILVHLYFRRISQWPHVPVSDPIPLSPLDQAGGDFHILHRQGYVSRKQLLKIDHPPSSTLKDFRDRSI